MGIIILHNKIFKIIISTIVICLLALLYLAASKRLNRIFIKKYSVYGIDVSHYQGKINWQMLKEQETGFAYIKATEGSSHTDKKFLKNWEHVQLTGIIAGAYHFFSFDSPASSQAEHFIETVGSLSGKLVPMVDVEYYADKEKNPPDKEQTIAQLQEFLHILEAEYNKKPVIYTTYKVYHRYIKGRFKQYPLWIRNVYYPPFDIDGGWQIWQYSDIGKTEGINSSVDLDVFSGTKEEFAQFIVP
ncbi:MAG TPA: glycoside hydrolase family 25 [Lachnospiraceae bacterium]|nr:glycoside hydrolase family 25 [Lachnospiraceae bacterium]